MIEQLINLFDAASDAPVSKRYGLAILGDSGPMVHAGGAQYTVIAVDNTAPWSYWRVSNLQSTPADNYTCDPGAIHRMTVRLVMLVPTDCGGDTMAMGVANRLRGSLSAAKELLGAIHVRINSERVVSDGVAAQEKIGPVPLQWMVIALDLDVEVRGTADCLAGCTDSSTLLCAVIATSTDSEVVACLGSRIDDICESGGPCDPLAWTLTDTEDNVLDTGSVTDPCGGSLAVEAPNAAITRDGVPYGSALSGGTLNVVSNTTPCDPVTIQLRDSGGTAIGAPDVYAAGTVASKTAPDGTVRTTDGVTTVTTVKSNGAVNLPESVIAYMNAAGGPAISSGYPTIYASLKLKPGVVIPRREMKNSAGVGLGLWVALDQLLDDTLPQTPNGSVQAVDSAAFAIGSPVAALSGGPTATVGIPDSVITLPNDTTTNLRATQPFDARPYSAMEIAFADRDQYTMVWTITAFNAGVYRTFLNTGTYGTITYSKNGGAFVAPVSPITLAVGNTIQLFRTNTAGVAGSTWGH